MKIHGRQVFTLMQRRVWEALAKPGEQMKQHLISNFVLADGKVQTSEGRIPVTYEWHGMFWTVDTYVMSDQKLSFPLILGLDFLSQTGVRLQVGEHSYELCINGRMSLFPFLCQPLGVQIWSQQEERVVNVYMALPLDSELLKPLTGVDDVMQKYPEVIQQLLQAWPSLCSDKLGRTNVATHQIITTDAIPGRCKAYRVSPLKKEII